VACYEASARSRENLIGPGGGVQIAKNSQISVELDPKTFVVQGFDISTPQIKKTPLVIDFRNLAKRHIIAVGGTIQNAPSAVAALGRGDQAVDAPILIIEVLLLDSTGNIRERRVAAFNVTTWESDDARGLTRSPKPR